MALSANDADGYKSWLVLGIEQLGRDVAAEDGAFIGGRRERQADGLAARREPLVLLRLLNTDPLRRNALGEL